MHLLGTLDTLEIGLVAIRRQCSYFGDWLARLEKWRHESSGSVMRIAASIAVALGCLLLWLTPAVQVVLASLLLATNLAVYAWVLRRWRR